MLRAKCWKNKCCHWDCSAAWGYFFPYVLCSDRQSRIGLTTVPVIFFGRDPIFVQVLYDYSTDRNCEETDFELRSPLLTQYPFPILPCTSSAPFPCSLCAQHTASDIQPSSPLLPHLSHTDHVSPSPAPLSAPGPTS